MQRSSYRVQTTELFLARFAPNVCLKILYKREFILETGSYFGPKSSFNLIQIKGSDYVSNVSVKTRSYG